MGAGPVTGPNRQRPRAELEAAAAARRADAGHRRQWLCRSAGGEGVVPDLRLAGEWPDGIVGGKGAGCRRSTQVAPITDATARTSARGRHRLHLDGPAEVGPGQDALATFSAPFREGMYQEDRLRRLGDRIEGKWQATVIDGGPRWSGNIPVRRTSRTLTGSGRAAAPPDAR